MRFLLSILALLAIAASASGAEPPPETFRVVYHILYVDENGKVLSTYAFYRNVKYADWVAKYGPLNEVDYAMMTEDGYIQRTVEFYDGII